MNEREYERLRKQILDDCQRGLDALDHVWALATGAPPPRNKPVRKSAAVRDAVPGGIRGQITEAVNSAIQSLGSEFNTSEIEESVKASISTDENSRSTISHTLKRLEKAGKLTIVMPGRGRRPTVYRKLGTTNGHHAAPDPSEQPHPGNEPCAPEIQSEIRLRLKETGYDLAELKQHVLVEKYGVHRIAELMKSDADDLLHILRAAHHQSETLEEYFEIH